MGVRQASSTAHQRSHHTHLFTPALTHGIPSSFTRVCSLISFFSSFLIPHVSTLSSTVAIGGGCCHTACQDKHTHTVAWNPEQCGALVNELVRHHAPRVDGGRHQLDLRADVEPARACAYAAISCVLDQCGTRNILVCLGPLAIRAQPSIVHVHIHLGSRPGVLLR